METEADYKKGVCGWVVVQGVTMKRVNEYTYLLNFTSTPQRIIGN